MIDELHITTCPTCGSKRIKKVCRTVKRKFRGKPYTVPDLEYMACPDCGERLYDRDAMRKIQACSPAYAKGKARLAAGSRR